MAAAFGFNGVRARFQWCAHCHQRVVVPSSSAGRGAWWISPERADRHRGVCRREARKQEKMMRSHSQFVFFRFLPCSSARAVSPPTAMAAARSRLMKASLVWEREDAGREVWGQRAPALTPPAPSQPTLPTGVQRVLPLHRQHRHRPRPRRSRRHSLDGVGGGAAGDAVRRV